LADHDKAIALTPAVYTYAGRSVTRRIAGNISGALEDIREAIGRAPQNSACLHLLAWEIYRLEPSAIDPVAATTELAAASAVAADPWEQALVAYFTGQMDENELLSSAGLDDTRHAEAFYYAGVKALAEGRTDAGLSSLRHNINFRFADSDEYGLAKLHMANVITLAEPTRR
jgi:hypothetical protein